MISFFRSLKYIIKHPLNDGRTFGALSRWFRWQLSSRLALGPMAVPFVGETRLLVSAGMTGATGNIYCGLHEYEDMSFILHVLRPGDLFFDIGANVGSYSVLAAGASGAKVKSFEPVPTTYRHLMDNISINRLGARVEALNCAVGSSPGTIRFTTSEDTVNHVVAKGELAESAMDVPVIKLDDCVEAGVPMVMKIDVEGFETEVLKGGEAVFSDKSLKAVVMELNGSGLRYGYDEAWIRGRMAQWGFRLASYDPKRKVLNFIDAVNDSTPNALYVRDDGAVQARLAGSASYSINGTFV